MRAIIIITVSGSNIMGDALCQMSGVVTAGSKVKREISYEGPVLSAEHVIQAISEVFEKPEGA